MTVFSIDADRQQSIKARRCRPEASIETTAEFIETALQMPLSAAAEHAKRKTRKNFGRRNAIEPVSQSLNYYFRLARNYLKGMIGDAVNLPLAAAAFNCGRWTRAVANGLLFVLFTLLHDGWGKGEAADC